MKEGEQQFYQSNLINYWSISHYHKCKVEDKDDFRMMHATHSISYCMIQLKKVAFINVTLIKDRRSIIIQVVIERERILLSFLYLINNKVVDP